MTALYNRYLHPLRGYPGPFLWTCFRLPYVVSTFRGDLHSRLDDFHVRYGDIVRIAPDELSYIDSRAWSDIYGTHKGLQVFERNRHWFKKKESEEEPRSIMTYDESDHKRFRRVFEQAFTRKSLLDQAQVFERYADLFIQRLKSLVDKDGSGCTVDLTQWFNFYTFDVAGHLSFGEPSSCLENSRPDLSVEIASDFGKGLALLAVCNLYWPLDSLFRFLIPERIAQRNQAHKRLCAEKARRRLAVHTDLPDFVTPAKTYSEGSADLSITPEEWGINMAAFVLAASETTASALTAIVRRLVQNPDVLERLTEEIRDYFQGEEPTVSSKTGHLKLLNAVIDEGMRLDPPISIGLPRVVPQGGATVCGKRVAGGVCLPKSGTPLLLTQC